MSDILAGIVLAAGAGTRLRPLTWYRAKALCPVANVALVDLALSRVAALVGEGAGHLAVNVHHHGDQLEAHLDARVHVSREEPRALGTAGAVGQLRGWLSGRGAVVVNADTWSPDGLAHLVEGWDGERVRVLVAGGAGLQPDSVVVASLLPPAVVADLAAEPSGLYEVCWSPAAQQGALEVISHPGTVVDCGTPADYLRANLAASGGTSVVADGAQVEGVVERSVLWSGAVVHRDEHLRDAIRIGPRQTVLVR